MIVHYPLSAVEVDLPSAEDIKIISRTPVVPTTTAAPTDWRQLAWVGVGLLLLSALVVKR